MTAKEVRELVRQHGKVTALKDNVTYVKIMKAIEAAIAKDECFEIWWYETINQRLESRLTTDGFTVTNHNDRDGTLYKISWAETKHEKNQTRRPSANGRKKNGK